FMDLSHSSALSSVSQNFVSSDVVDESCVSSGSSLNALTEEIVAYEKESDETHDVKKLDALCTPESFVTHFNFDTPSGVYYIPKVYADVLLVKGNVYDSVDVCVVAYLKYAAEARFVVRRSCQKRLRNGDVKQKYLVCNRKGIYINTLDLENSEKQKRNSNLHITGCKARAVFNLDPRTRKFVLNVFDTIQNHELEREVFKHLSKRERQLTYSEQAFIVKAASVNICATRTHHLLTGIKGSYLLVHGTTVDFKNFFRSVNCYILDSDAQMLIHKMENRKKHVSDFLFDYLVENAELSGIFWADEVYKYNYREFDDVVSFDATFKTNKYKMVFVPFTAIDNHRKCVTVATGLLKNETTKSYIWLLKAFIEAFGKAHSIVVTDQVGAMRNVIEADFAGSKHRLCMWHITQKLPAKIVSPNPAALSHLSAKHAPLPANPKPKAPKLKASDVTEFDQGVGSGSEEGDGSGSEEEGDEEEDEKEGHDEEDEEEGDEEEDEKEGDDEEDEEEGDEEEDKKEGDEEECHTPRRGLDGIRVRGRDVIIIRTQGT
ncbi:FAR1-related sequence 5-like protein, partial [Tanacetum coccineum]